MFGLFSPKILNDLSLNEMRSRFATLFFFFGRNLKKVVSDGTAGGV